MDDTRLPTVPPVPEPIAIIGIGCRFPGGAINPDTFWRRLQSGFDAITEVPADRWSVAAHYSADHGRPGKSYARHGGFLEQVDRFDAAFFGISPREAMRMDPQQRLALELAWEAFEDAGLNVEALAGSQTSVYLSITAPEYFSLQVHPAAYPQIDSHTGTGFDFSILANRVSYLFDLRGPSVALDTACSGSLVAVHQACQTLWHEGCSLALAGGVHLNLKPDGFVMHSKASMLSPTGRSRAFDARADGFVRAEGGGIVVLKPLAAAICDGDRIYAVIRGTAVNQDGRTPSLTMPNGQAQMAAIRQALARAGVEPRQIQYIEAHGTGTPVGDPIEATAIGKVLGQQRGAPCVIGSVKSNLGHLEAAAGVAGLTKLALSLHHAQIPPNLHFQTPNARIPLDELRLRVPTTLEPWPANEGGAPRLAGINSFGFGGTNAHAVLAEAPLRPHIPATAAPESERAELLVLSARSEAALRDLAQAYRQRLAEPGDALSDICYSAMARRSHHPHRLALVAATRDGLVERLQAFCDGQPQAGLNSGRAGSDAAGLRPVFVFSGMGQQWPRMGWQLFKEEPVFRSVLEACDQELGRLADWSLLDVLRDDTHPIDRTEIAQVAIFAVQVALSALWRAWGIIPHAVVGHSVGEVAAAHVAGALSLPEALTVVFHRSRLQATTAGQGSMLAVGLPADEVRPWLKGYEASLAIGAVNSPRSVTLAGDTPALQAVAQALSDAQVFNRFLKVEVPYHSPLMEPLMAPLAAALAGLRPKPAEIAMFSTVTGQAVAGPELTGHYWARNVRDPVRFAAAIAAMSRAGLRLFVEIGAHPVLGTSLKECLGESSQVLSSLRRGQPERECLLNALGSLYCIGFPLDGTLRYPDGRYVSLPGQVWQRSAYWQESEESRRHRLGEAGHPLLGRRLDQPQPAWECDLDLERLPYLRDHRIHGEAIFPASAYSEMAIAAARELFGPGDIVLSDLRVDKALILQENRATRLHLAVTPDVSAFAIYSIVGEAWTRHARGTFGQQPANGRRPPFDIAAIRRRCTRTKSGAACYQDLTSIGYDYGPAFQGVHQAFSGDSETLLELRWPAVLPVAGHGYHAHPAVIDAYFNGILAVLAPRRTWLPIRIDECVFYEPPGQRAWLYGRVAHLGASQLDLDLYVLGEDGRVLLATRGMLYQALDRDAAGSSLADHTYEYRWEAQPRSEPEPGDGPGRWLILADSCGVGEQLAGSLRAAGGQPVLVFSGPASGPAGPDRHTVPTADPQALGALIGRLGHFDKAVHLWSLPYEPGDDVVTAQQSGSLSVLAVCQTLGAQSHPPRLWLVTCAVQGQDGTPPRVAHAPIWGLGRVVANELPALQPRLVDLQHINRAEVEGLFAEICSDSPEDEVALCDENRFVRRLKPLPLFKTGGQIPFRLAVHNAGTLDSLVFETAPLPVPGPGQIAIEVEAAGLNFKDIAKAMNLIDAASLAKTYAGNSVGIECAGRVHALGPGVCGLQVGDAVIAMASHCFSRYVVTEAAMVVRKSAAMDFAAAATLPIAYLTAYAALRHFGRAQAGERILIHTAAGGVGQAAVQLAKRLGLEICATAGSAEKREFLRAQGIVHVMDSRSLTFASELLDATNGAGVDLVLNTLPARTIPKSLSLLRPRGRFIDLSNFYNDAHLELGPFQKGLSVSAFDLDQLMQADPAFMADLFQEAMAYVAAERLPPLPQRIFPLANAKEAFRYMAQAQHVGKVVLTLERPEEIAVGLTNAAPPRLDGAAGYLVTGGTSGFGLATARWLAACGARHLALLSRQGLATPAAQEAVAALQAEGIAVLVVRTDVGRSDELAQALAEVRRSLPPLKGIVHAATVYDDQVLQQLTPAGFNHVLLPKAIGAWYLHQLTRELPLDFFILYSSVAVTIGNPGQANYAAANAMLDALAQHRSALELPALSVAWGGIAETGYLARQTAIGTRLQQAGVELLSPGDALRHLGVLLRHGTAQATVAVLSWPQLSQRLAALRTPRFSAVVPLTDAGTPAEASLAEQVAGAEPAARSGLVAAQLSRYAAQILGIAAEKLDPHTPLTRLGLDSLMAVELSQYTRRQLGLEVSSMRLLSGDSIERLAEQLLPQLLQRKAAAPPPALTRRTAAAPCPLSFLQLPMWRLDQRVPGRSFFNLPTLAHFRGRVELPLLEQALQAVIARHEALRTTFTGGPDQPLQQFAPAAPQPLPVEDLSTLPVAARTEALNERLKAEAERPFDLSRQWPVRTQILLLGPDELALIVTLHHICSDGASIRVFFEDLYAFYRAAAAGQTPALPALPVQYGDFALWQKHYFQGDACAPMVEQMRQLLDGRLPALPLPTDRPRPSAPSLSGARYRFAFSKTLGSALREAGQAEQSTLFMMLLTALGILVNRYTGLVDFCLGTFVANRNRPEERGLVGCFINALPLRVQLHGDPSFRTALARVRTATLAAQGLAELPFAILQEHLAVEMPAPQPAVQVVLVLHNELESTSDFRIRVSDGIEVTHREGDNQGAKRDWTFHLFDMPEGITGYLEYDTDLFEAATIERVVQDYRQLLEQILTAPGQPLSELTATPAAGRPTECAACCPRALSENSG